MPLLVGRVECPHCTHEQLMMLVGVDYKTCDNCGELIKVVQGVVQRGEEVKE